MFTDIPNGSLYRLEGWELIEKNFNLEEYRTQDPDWQSIKFEGYFLDPKQIPEANQDFTLKKYIRFIVDDCYEQEIVKNGNAYILFMVPQNCESIIKGSGYKDDPNDFSSDDDGDYDNGVTIAFICKDKNVMDISRYKILPMLGKTWESALKDSPEYFIE